jgi:hypothetical protein
MHFDIAVVGVGLARKQRFKLAPLALGVERPERRDSLGFDRVVALGLAKVDQRRRVVEVALNFRQRASRSSSIVRSRISFSANSGSVQRLGSSDLAFSSARRRVAASTSKMPPQQSHGLLDRFDQLFGFCAHDPTHKPDDEMKRPESLSPLKRRRLGTRTARR